MRSNVTKHIIVGIIFVLSHVLIFQYLTILGAFVDPVLVFVLWTALRYNRTEVLFFAAGFGLFQDALFDIWGINMFAKTLTTFLLYKIIARNSNVRLLTWQVFGFVWGAAILHNVFYMAFSNFLDTYTYGFSPIILLVGCSTYTAVIGTILFILKGDSN